MVSVWDAVLGFVAAVRINQGNQLLVNQESPPIGHGPYLDFGQI